MRSVIIHMGMPKTGTSALQTFFKDNAVELSNNGITYCLQDDEAYWMGNAYSLLETIPESHLWSYSEAKIKDIIDKLEDNKTLLLSSECLWLLQDKASFLKCFISEDIRIKVIVYLRSQEDFLNSAISQNVKDGLSNWSIILDLAESESGQIIYNYWNELEKISSVIGRENIIVRVYEKKQLVGGSIIPDFMDALRWPLTEKYIIPNELINTRILPEYLKLVESCSKIPVSRDLRWRVISDTIIKLSSSQIANPPTTLFLSKECMEKFRSRYKDSNRRIAVEYLYRDDGQLFYYNEVKKDGIFFEDVKYSMDDAVRLFAFISCQQDEKIVNLDERVLSLVQQQKIEKFDIDNLQTSLWEDSQQNVEKVSFLEKKIEQLSEEVKAKNEELELKNEEIVSIRYQLAEIQQTVNFLVNGRITPWSLNLLMVRLREWKNRRKKNN